MKAKCFPLFILVVFALMVFLPKTEAVVPAPDGGYPGGNTAEGQSALLNLTNGPYNTAIGWLSLSNNTTGRFNTAIGAGTLPANIADQNTATGAGALVSNYTGISNTANGAFALLNNSTGSANTGYGAGALSNNTTGSGNTALGIGAGQGVTGADGVITIGSSGGNVSNSCFIGHIRGIQTANANAIPVLIDSDGQLGTQSSSRRFKKEIKPMVSASEAVLALKPVTFHYKSDKTNTPQFGLIAEEVAQVNPDLVVRDDKSEIYTVRYDAVNAMLLNEFLKEHSKNEEQQRQIEALTAQLKEQGAQLQRVSAQFELSRRAPQVVVKP